MQEKYTESAVVLHKRENREQQEGHCGVKIPTIATKFLSPPTPKNNFKLLLL